MWHHTILKHIYQSTRQYFFASRWRMSGNKRSVKIAKPSGKQKPFQMVYNSIYDDSLCLVYFYLLMQIYFILYIFTTFFLFKYWESVCKSTWKSTWRLIALHGIQNLSIKRVAKKGNWYGNCIKCMYLSKVVE